MLLEAILADALSATNYVRIIESFAFVVLRDAPSLPLDLA